jgi:hypothetical protein
LQIVKGNRKVEQERAAVTDAKALLLRAEPEITRSVQSPGSPVARTVAAGQVGALAVILRFGDHHVS